MQHFKKLLAILLCAPFIFTVVACDSGKDPVKTDPSKPAESGDPVDTDKPDDPVKPDDPDKLSLENIKIGFVHITDPSDMGYTYNHDLGTQKMQKELGLKDDQIINKFNTSEDETCENALRELAEQGCHIIFATSFGFEDYVIKVAKDYPDIEFCHATGYKAASAGLDNVHNYFGKIYQARYLSGIAAGLKTEKNKLGYVGAFPFPEVISGFTAFYLGAKSVNPDVKMTVKYTHSWNNPTLEAQLAQALIDEGCDVLDSTATRRHRDRLGPPASSTSDTTPTCVTRPQCVADLRRLGLSRSFSPLTS